MVTAALLSAAALLVWPDLPDRAGRRAHAGRSRWQHPMRLGAVACWWRASAAGRRLADVGVAVGVGLGLALAVSWSGGLAGGVACATCARLTRRARADRGARRNVQAAAAALRTVARDLHAGVAPSAAVADAMAAAPRPVAAILASLPGAGGSMGLRPLGRPAGRPAGAELAGAHTRLLAGWDLSARQGIPLAAVVTTVADDLLDLARAADDRAAQVAGPAVSGYVLAALPLAGLLLGAGMGTDPLAVLTGSTIGGFLLIAGIVLCCAGLLWADRIVRA